MHNRRSIRLKGYDYLQAGLYFVTCCCYNRKHLFGQIINAEMILNACGHIARDCWLNIPKHYPHVVLHEYIIMPNHVHGIIEFVDIENTSTEKTNVTVGAKNFSPLHQSPKTRFKDFIPPHITPIGSPSKTIGSVVRGFKIGVTNWMRKNTDIYDVWKRDYYEHIIRDERSYQNISEYIINNPAKWEEDMFYR